MHYRAGLLFVLVCAAIEIQGKPTLYKRNEDNIFEPVMVPVSSTVIPLLDYKVSSGFVVESKDKHYQSSHKPDGIVKLITAKAQEKKE